MPPKKSSKQDELPSFFTVIRDIFMANMPRWSKSINQSINQSVYKTNKTGKNKSANQSIEQPTEKSVNWKFVLKWSIWLIGLIILYREDFGSIYLICTAIYLIFTNLSNDESDERSIDQSASQSKQPNKQKLSAYAAFNHGARIPGSLSMGSFEQNWSTTKSDDQSVNQSTNPNILPPLPKRASKSANSKCVCGSGKKFKVCCSPDHVDSKATRLAEKREAKEMWGVDD